MSNEIVAVRVEGEFRVDSRVMATQFGNQHKNVLALVTEYAAQFAEFGTVAFETRPLPGGGKPERFALLNEDQSIFLLTLSRNSSEAVALKVSLVHAFRKARDLLSAVPTLPPTAPALISARGIAASTGQSPRAAGTYLIRLGIKPTHHCFDPRCHAPAYLWPIEHVQALFAERGWKTVPLTPYTGEAFAGVAPVQKMLATTKRTGSNHKRPKPKAAPQQQKQIPLFFDEVERVGAELGAAHARRLTEEFIRNELPGRIRAELMKGVLA